MTEVLTSLFAPLFVLLVLVVIAERITHAMLSVALFAKKLLTEPQPPLRTGVR